MIKFLRQYHHLRTLCQQQAQELSDKGELIAELIAENQQLKRTNQVMQENAKIAKDRNTVYAILAQKMIKK